MAFTVEEAPYYLWNKDFCQKKQKNRIDTIILGDSVAGAAYMPEVLSSSTVNLSLSGSSPMENYYILEDYLNHNQTPKHAFISFMDFHFTMADCYWTRALYSHRFSPKQNWEMLQQAKKFKELSIIDGNPELRLLSYQLYLPNKYITSLTNASLNQRLEKNIAAYNFDNLHRGRHVAVGNYEGSFEGVHYTEFNVKPLLDMYYRKIIKLCIEKGIEVHLVKLPLPSASSFDESYKSQFNEYYRKLQEDYPSIAVDWFRDGYDNFCFSDIHHMNTHGALRFSLQLKEQYSDIFSNEMDGLQLDCLHQDIKDENRFEDLFLWIKNSPSTLILYDHGGDFESYYENNFKKNTLHMKKYFIDTLENSNIYIFSNSEKEMEGIILEKIVEGFAVYSSSSKDESLKYSWNISNTNGLEVLIINNTDGKIVTEKKFDYANEPSYSLK